MTYSTVNEAGCSSSLHARFAENVQRWPEAAAVVSGGRQLSYQELDDRANAIAALLQIRGAGPDGIVAVMMNRSIEMIAAIMGVLKSGAAYLPIDPALPHERISYMLGNSKALALVTQNELAPVVGEIECTGYVLAVDEVMAAAASSEKINYPNQSNDLSYIIYTSGTTGRPKGVMIEHRNVLNLMLGLQDIVYKHYSLTPLKIALVAPYYFDASVQQIFAALLYGHCLYIVPEDVRIDGRKLLAFYAEHDITITDGTPAHLSLLSYAMSAAGQSTAVQHFIIGGEELTGQTIEAFYSCFGEHKPAVTNIYGPTECCVDSLAYQVVPPGPSVETAASVPIGKPLLNQSVYLFDEDRAAIQGEGMGELFISGAGVGRGYLHLPELTEQCFLPDPFDSFEPEGKMYKTGDIVRRLSDGNIAFVGRADDQVKIRGFRIELGEVRARLLQHPDVIEAAVVSRRDAGGEPCICAYVVPRSDMEADAASLHAFAAEGLPSYMIPAHFVPMEQLPLTRNGKLDRNALPEPLESGAREIELPASAAEERLLPLWRGVLGISSLGVLDHFFEWGGHSLKANMLISGISQQFGVEVSLLDIFDNPTVRQLAACIEASDREAAAAIESAGRRDNYPLSFAQKWMYILSAMDTGGVSWNMPGVIRIEGELDAARFCDAVKEFVRRHDIMRASFKWTGGVPVQVIHPNVEPTIPVIDGDEQQLDGFISRFVRPFDTGSAPLLRMELVKLSESLHMLLFDAHHLIFDGASIGIFMSETAQLYSGAVLPEPKLQYQDFAVWQEGAFTADRLAKLESYWLNEFSGELPVLELPTDRPRNGPLSGRGETLHLTIEGETVGKVNRLSVETGSSLYMILLTGLNILLYKYTGQEDIIVGSLSAGRGAAQWSDIPGMFVQTLPMRNFPQGNKTASVFLREVKERSLQAVAHEEFPADRLEQLLAPKKRDRSRSLYDVMLTFLNFEDQEMQIPGLAISSSGIDLALSRYDFVIEAKQSAAGIALQLSFSTDLFEKGTIVRMMDDYSAILAELADNREASLKEIAWSQVQWESEQEELTDEIDFAF